jgi:pyridoxal phosphate enzyme (YggS family)
MGMDASAIAQNVAGIRERIARAAARAGRRADEVTLVAISKTFPGEAIRAAWEAGVRHFGENRVQEWEGKRAEVADLAATWHLVGHLQGNKARRAAHQFHAVDSIDSLDLARRLDSALAEDSEGRLKPAPHGRLRVLVEVRLAPEETKTGAEPADVGALARGILELPRLDLRGLMCIPPLESNPEQARLYFRRLREMRDALRAALAVTPGAAAAASRGEAFLPVLSMGMSHDFEVAIEEGATEVRIGTALFGARG